MSRGGPESTANTIHTFWPYHKDIFDSRNMPFAKWTFDDESNLIDWLES